ncbi:hypothetical protein GCM10009761_05460 [Agromyces terreus]
MVEIEDTNVSLPTVDARMREEIRADAFEVSSPGLRDLYSHRPTMMLEILNVVASGTRFVASPAHRLIAIARRLAQIEV